MSAYDTIRSSPLFNDLYEKEVKSLLQASEVVKYRAEEYIIRQGEEGTTIYVMLNGKARAELTKDGKKSVLTEFKAGDAFGEMVLIDEHTRTSDIITCDECDILIIDQEDIYALYKKNAQAFAVLALNLARMLTKRLKFAVQSLTELKEKQMAEVQPIKKKRRKKALPRKKMPRSKKKKAA